ncbi:MAG: transglutaminase domain-containing protein [Candidatus Marinimicrobia bacterium]|nr:transglutaminase domain-containing protein [Candidatus Neomarinimicrobiota bacterium]
MKLILKIFFLIIFTVSLIFADNINLPHKNTNNISKKLSRKIKKDPEKNIQQLVNHLINGVNDDFEKVKVLHDWVALNIEYDIQGYFGNSKIEYDPYDVMKSGKSVCEGYSNIMKTLCDLAKIECVKISGYGRGVGFNIFSEIEKLQPNHAWNVVKIKNKWYLVDATWDAGHLDGKKFKRKYSTNYLFLEPEKFIYTHFPEDSKWQLLKKSINFKKFKTLPFLGNGFFSNGLEIGDKYSLITNTKKSYKMIFKSSKDIQVSAVLSDNNGKKYPDNAIIQRDGEKFIVNIIFPKKGKYIFGLYVKSDPKDNQFTEVARFGFVTKSGLTSGFPKLYGPYFENNCFINNPLQSPLKKNSNVKFDIKIDNIDNLGVKIDGKFIELMKNINGKFTGEEKITGKKVVLYYLDNKTNQYNFICEWSVK